MDGFELTRRLRQDPRTATVSIIMLTARGLSADKLEGFAIGADDYIVKPFDTPELLARIRGVLRRVKRDARAVAAHRPARQRPDRGGDRRPRGPATGVRDPVRRPRPLQGVQRPLRVHARRPGDPVDGLASSRRWHGRSRTATRSSVTSAATTSCVVVPAGEGRPTWPRRSWRASTKRRPASTTPTTATAGTSRSRTAAASCSGSRCCTISIGVATHREARTSQHYAEAVAVATEMKAVHEGDRGLVVGDRPHERV